MSPFEVYCIMQLDALRSFMHDMAVICVFGVLCCAIWCIGVFILFDSKYNDDIEARRKYIPIAIRWGICIAILSITLDMVAAFVPSTKTATAMYLVPHVLNNESVQQLPADIAAYLRRLIRYEEHQEGQGKKTEIERGEDA